MPSARRSNSPHVMRRSPCTCAGASGSCSATTSQTSAKFQPDICSPLCCDLVGADRTGRCDTIGPSEAFLDVEVVSVGTALPERTDFDDFVADVEPRLRRALVAAYGPEAGREATADALAWAWQHWDRLRGWTTPPATCGGSARPRFAAPLAPRTRELTAVVEVELAAARRPSRAAGRARARRCARRPVAAAAGRRRARARLRLLAERSRRSPRAARSRRSATTCSAPCAACTQPWRSPMTDRPSIRRQDAPRPEVSAFLHDRATSLDREAAPVTADEAARRTIVDASKPAGSGRSRCAPSKVRHEPAVGARGGRGRSRLIVGALGGFAIGRASAPKHSTVATAAANAPKPSRTRVDDHRPGSSPFGGRGVVGFSGVRRRHGR